MTNFMKEQLLSSDDIPFFSYVFYFLSHKFAFPNLHFLPFYEHFRQLREKYTMIKNKVHHVNQLIEPDLMMYIYIYNFYQNFPRDSTPLHSTELFKIFFSSIYISSTTQNEKYEGKKAGFLFEILKNFAIF